MGALSRLLKRVAIRAIENSDTNEKLFSAAERVVSWSNAGLISENDVEEIASHITGVDDTDGQEYQEADENASDGLADASEDSVEGA